MSLHAPCVFPPGDACYNLPIHVLFERCVEQLGGAQNRGGADDDVNFSSCCAAHAVVAVEEPLLSTPPSSTTTASMTSMSVPVVATTPTVTLTYAELNAAADAMASTLVEMGARVGAVVGIYLRRSAAYIVALLAILKTGAAYAPLETAYPRSLLDRVVANLDPVAIVTSESLRSFLIPEEGVSPSSAAANGCNGAAAANGSSTPGNHPTFSRLLVLPDQGIVTVPVVDRSLPPPSSLEVCKWRADAQHVATPETRCYVVFSSGSTGEPKGIEAPHRSPVYSYLWRMGLSGYSVGSRVGCSVFFVWECLRPLLCGGTSVVIPDAAAFDATALLDFLDAHCISELLLTPSLAENTLSAAGDTAFTRVRSLERLWLNGEAVSGQLRQRLLASLPPNGHLFNTYSISECGEVAACELTAFDEVSANTVIERGTAPSDAGLSVDGQRAMARCGQIAAFARVRVVDDDTITKEVDEGELIVSGPGVGTGYFGRRDLTSERFIHDTDGTLWYRTGDTARVDKRTQELIVLGRRAHMLKIRGYSVVPGAVEATIRRVAAVSACIVTVDGEEGSATKRLVAYIVRDRDQSLRPDRLSEFTIDLASGLCPILHSALISELPSYAVPTVWIELDSLPLLAPPLAKVDRSKLPKPPSGSFTHVVSPAEAFAVGSEHAADNAASAIAVMMGVVLDSAPISLDDSFFATGGNSLSASRLLAMLRARYVGTAATSAISIQALFDYSTPRALAQFLWQPHEDNDQYRPNGDESISRASSLTKDAARLIDRLTGNLRTNVARQRVVLTGATGFVGTGLLAELLAQDCHVTCIVRAKTDAQAHLRLADERVCGQAWDSAVTAGRALALAGDVVLPNFGLSEVAFTELGRSVNVIIHAAAYVNLLLPYESLYDANVSATANVLQLALAAENPVRFIFVSSTSVAGLNPLAEASDIHASSRLLVDGDFIDWPEDVVREVLSGYGQTKRVAESLVVGVARHSALVQPVIVRLGNVGPPLQHGSIGGATPSTLSSATNPADFTRLLCMSCCFARASLDGFYIEVTPRDVVARNIVVLARAHKPPTVAHVVNPSRIDARLLFDFLPELLPLGDFIARLRSKVEEATEMDKQTASGEQHGGMVQMHDEEAIRAAESVILLLSSRSSSELLKVPDFVCAATVAATQMPSTLLTIDYMKRAFSSPLWKQSMLPLAPASPPADTVSSLRNKLVVVLGASSGIGEAISRALVACGALVASCARRPCQPGCGLSIQCDVSKSADVEAALDTAERHYNAHIYALVNSAGVMYFERIETRDQEAWQQTVDVNVMGTLHSIGAATRLLLKRSSPGHLVFISSDAGRAAFDGLAVYSGSKYFIEGATRSMRRELAPKGIRVTTIQPGNVATPLASMCRDPTALAEFGAPSGHKVLEPKDVARAVVYALEQPAHVAINEVLIEPTGEPI